MKNRMVRSRALRAVLGGLLTSSLTDVELKKLAQELDYEFVVDLRDMLKSLPVHLEPDKAELYRDAVTADPAQLVYEKAKSKRVSKERMLVYMREIDQTAARIAGASESTLRGLIENFVANSGPGVAERLVSRVFGRPEQDPYLVGISERK